MSEKINDMKANILRLLTENAELKRERDKARNLVQSGIRAQASLNEALDKTLYDLRMAREQNAKLRDIAERALQAMESASSWWEHELRAELEQIKEGAK